MLDKAILMMMSVAAFKGRWQSGGRLLLETGDVWLLETGDAILLENYV